MSSAFGVICESMPLVTGVILLALLATPKRTSATARHQVLVVASILCLAAPFLLRSMPAWQVLPRPSAPVMAAVASVYQAETQVEAPAAAGSTLHESPVVTAVSAPQAVPPTAAPGSYRNWFRVVAALWLAGVALALLRVACNAAALRRWVRGSVAAPQELVDLAATISGPTVRLRIVAGEGDAFVYRVFSPVVVLPTSVASLPLEQIRMILEHEMAHVRRRDPLWAWVFEVFRAFYWFHPLAWVLVRRSHLAREMAADDLVLLDGRAPEAYAACLGAAALRHRTQAAPPLPALAFVRQHPVLARLHAILDNSRRRTAPSTGTWLSSGLPVAVPALVLASLAFKVAAEAQPGQRAPSKATTRVAPIPSVWSDLVEPLVAKASLPEPQPSLAVIAPAPHPAAPLVAPPLLPAPAPDRSAVRAPANFTPRGDEPESSTLPVSLPEGSPSRNGQAPTEPMARGFGFRRPVPPTPPPAPSEGPVSTPTKPSDPAGPLEPQQPGSDPTPPVVTPPNEPAPDPGSNPGSGDGDGGDGGETAPPDGPGDVITPPEPSFPTKPQPPVQPPESGPLPALQIIPFASEEGSHFAVTWTVPEAEADTWYPEVSGDQREWTSDPEVVAVDGPVAEQDGTVRFIAVIRVPMPASYHRFLRLTDTPGWRDSE